jgi:hypothetical protein
MNASRFDPEGKSDNLAQPVFKTSCRLLVTLVGATIAICVMVPVAFAQSSDQSLPSPVLTKEISGRINALDLGDPRLTRHYYAFSASPGDLLITVEGHNLNGDVDVFTAVTFRPLMKTTMIATSQSSEITKGIYLRAHQILILRVEARTPNDDPGSYHIRFGGTFEPFSGGIPVAENIPATESATDTSDANRLSSVGATIPRPVSETAEARPSPEATEEKKAVEKPSPTPRRNTARNTRRNTRPTPSRRTPAPKPATEVAKDKPAETTETPATPAETTTTTKPATEKPAKQELPQVPGTRLIIQQKDGTTINRPMSTVRRVVIEGPAIVIVLKTGKIERIPMSNVARMSIEPE